MLVGAVTLTIGQFLVLARKRKIQLWAVGKTSFRRAFIHTLPARAHSFAARTVRLAKASKNRGIKIALTHRASYGLIVILVALTSAPAGTVLTVTATFLLVALPISLVFANRALIRVEIESAVSQLLPRSHINSSPPEPVFGGPKVSPDVRGGSRIMATAGRPVPSTAIVRIVANDLPPRHRSGQTLQNLRFILDREPEFPGCRKIFLLNRMLNPDLRKEVLLAARIAKTEISEILFDPEEFKHAPLDFDCLPGPEFLESETFSRMPRALKMSALNAVFRHKNNYAMNNNGARNTAIDIGLRESEWVLPLDGNIFVPQNGWDSLIYATQKYPSTPLWVLPMRRLSENLGVDRNRGSRPVWEEPQIAFHQSSLERFSSVIPYGRRPKVDLLWKLGVPGPWQEYRQLPWDQPYPQESAEYGQFGFAGEVLRLSSGKGHLEKGASRSSVASRRNQAREEARLTYLVELERKFPSPDERLERLVWLSEKTLLARDET